MQPSCDPSSSTNQVLSELRPTSNTAVADGVFAPSLNKKSSDKPVHSMAYDGKGERNPTWNFRTLPKGEGFKTMLTTCHKARTVLENKASCQPAVQGGVRKRVKMGLGGKVTRMSCNTLGGG